MSDSTLTISKAQERRSIMALRDSIIHILRRRQEDACWFCSEELPQADNRVDVHHVIPLHVSFKDGIGHPSTLDDLRLGHRECHAQSR